MFRRILAAAVLAVAAFVAAPAAADAVPLPNPAELCSAAPEPEKSSQTIAGAIDIGAPSPTTSGGGYTQRGMGGFASHLYNPGCFARGTEILGEHFGNTSGAGLAAKSVTGPSRITTALMAVLEIAGTVGVLLLRLATAPGVIWDALTAGEQAARAVAGWPTFMAWVTFGCVGVGLWLMGRSRKTTSLAETWSTNATAAVIVLSGFLVAGWQVGPGPSVDRAVTAVWAAVGQASTGSSDPAAAFGDFWVDHVMVPTYGIVHLGPSGDAADKYAERLWQAQSYTRAEEAAALADPAVDADLVRRKKADYRAVAEEVKASDPAAYKRLSGEGQDSRPAWALLSVLLTLPTNAVVSVCAAGAAVARFVARYGVAIWPAVAVLTMHPSLHGWGRTYASEFGRFLLLGALSLAGLGAYMPVMSAIVNADGVPWLARMIGAAGLTAFVIAMWKRRDELAKKAHIHRQVAAVEAAANASVHAASRASRGVKERWDESRPPEPAGGDARAATPPAAPEQTIPAGRVHDVVKARRNAETVAASRVDPVASPTTLKTSASMQDIESAAARLSGVGRPTESTFRAREFAHLTAKTSRKPAVKPVAAATSTVTRGAVRAVGGQRLAKSAATSTASLLVPAARPVTVTARLGGAAARLIKR